ncbi:MAG: hypothetical protein ACI8WB_001522 [Phenylobacterium sp.]|jgi:hypothetical protein
MSLQAQLDEMLIFAEEQVNKLSQKTKLEKQLVKEMPIKFEENIQAFIKYLPDVAAEFRHYRPKNLKLYCTPSGVANIIDTKTGDPLYSEDPKQQCREQVDRLIANPQFTSLSFSQDENETNTFIHTKYLAEMYKIFLDAEKVLEPMTTVPDHLGSTILFGIGLGYHMRPFVEDITVDHLYICEPNRDWFFASLYTCDWKYVLETIDERDGNVVLNLGVSYEQFSTDFINELKDKGSFNAVNSLLYQHYPSEDLTKLIDRFHSEFHLLAIGWGFFDDGIISIAHEAANGHNKMPLLSQKANLPKAWGAIPAFMIANGPSLDTAIDTIKAYQGDAVVFSCGSALGSLLKAGIVPDFHVALERTRGTYDFLTEFTDVELLKTINFLTVSIMHPSVPPLFKWTGMALKNAEPSTTLISEFIDGNKTFAQLKYCNPQVANTGLAFISYLGFEEVYMFGVDGGYKDPEHHHSKHSVYYKDNGEEKETLGNYIRSGEIVVDGNFGGKVFSPVFYNTGRVYLGHCLNEFKKQVNCYNCSDGAKIENSTPVRPDDVMLMPNLPDKYKVIEHIKTDSFLDREFDEEVYMQWIAVDKFYEIIDTMVEFVDKEFTSRAELADALKQQVRYLFSYSHTRYRHVYFMMEGSLTYVHAVFRMMLYGFADEQESIKVMHDGIKVFITYMTEAKKKYGRVLEEIDNQDSSLLDMFREQGVSDVKKEQTV